MARRKLIRKIPGAARELMRARAAEYTNREWSEALDVHVETVRDHFRVMGKKPKRAPWRMHSFEEQRRRAERVVELRRLIESAVTRRPDPPPRRADVSRMTPTARLESPRLTYRGQAGLTPLMLRMARLSIRGDEAT